MRTTVPRSVWPCLEAGASETEQVEAIDGFSKKCEPLIGSENIIEFVKSGFVGLRS